MKRCFLIVGPESSGNRLLGAILTRAGCAGRASTDQRWDRTLPVKATPAMIIRSFPHGEDWPDLSEIYCTLEERGYQVTTLVTVRHPAATIGSQVQSGLAGSDQEACDQIAEAYQQIFQQISRPFHLVPYEAITYGPPAALRALLTAIGLAPVTAGPLIIDGQERDLEDGNAKHFRSN